jgi:hypothetical protein
VMPIRSIALTSDFCAASSLAAEWPAGMAAS